MSAMAVYTDFGGGSLQTGMFALVQPHFFAGLVRADVGLSKQLSYAIFGFSSKEDFSSEFLGSKIEALR